MAKTVYVVDGMGGGIGAQIVQRIRKELGDEVLLLALATNAVAAQRMVDSGAARGASGENAFRVCLPEADFIVGPLGIVLPNSMMGELTPAMAEAVFASRGKKILLPLAQSHFTVVGLAGRNVGELIDEAIAAIKK
jgi:NAD(P)-dependent dehydrogenase (short-subunit alcohol dehydrogenase family)